MLKKSSNSNLSIILNGLQIIPMRLLIHGNVAIIVVVEYAIIAIVYIFVVIGTIII